MCGGPLYDGKIQLDRATFTQDSHATEALPTILFFFLYQSAFNNDIPFILLKKSFLEGHFGHCVGNELQGHALRIERGLSGWLL